jgi:hypothetical protein
MIRMASLGDAVRKFQRRAPRERFRRHARQTESITVRSTWVVSQGIREPYHRAQTARREPSGGARAVRLVREEEPECDVTTFATRQRYDRGLGGWAEIPSGLKLAPSSQLNRKKDDFCSRYFSKS